MGNGRAQCGQYENGAGTKHPAQYVKSSSLIEKWGLDKMDAGALLIPDSVSVAGLDLKVIIPRRQLGEASHTTIVDGSPIRIQTLQPVFVSRHSRRDIRQGRIMNFNVSGAGRHLNHLMRVGGETRQGLLIQQHTFDDHRWRLWIQGDW